MGSALDKQEEARERILMGIPDDGRVAAFELAVRAQCYLDFVGERIEWERVIAESAGHVFAADARCEALSAVLKRVSRAFATGRAALNAGSGFYRQAAGERSNTSARLDYQGRAELLVEDACNCIDRALIEIDRAMLVPGDGEVLP